jgi:23S rRNA pseudouridine2605 synthase
VPEERLQKIIASAGIASRRKAEELITQGRVTLNGQIVSELGTRADPERDHIKVDGKLLRGAERRVYLLLNKPRGYVTTVSDPEGRPTVMELVKDRGERIYPVGRLDYGSEGLLLLTNDGELANHLTRASSHVPKTYLVKVSGQPTDEDIESLRNGIRIGSKPGPRGVRAVHTAPAQIRIVREAENPWYEVTLIEGKNRQIRRMFEEVGHHVEKIKRVRYGPLTLDVEPGESRELTQKEIAALRRARADKAPAQSAARDAKLSTRFLGKSRPDRRDDSRRGRNRDRNGPRERSTRGDGSGPREKSASFDRGGVQGKSANVGRSGVRGKSASFDRSGVRGKSASFDRSGSRERSAGFTRASRDARTKSSQKRRTPH